jgi:hypothetical protein
MQICRATKANGEPCTLPANESQGVCWAHSPQNRERRRRNASKAARAKGSSREVRELKAELRELIRRVERGEISSTRGNTMLRGYSVLIDLIKLERGVLEVEELSNRIEELKRGYSQETS